MKINLIALMKFLKKGMAYNELAKGFNGTYMMLNEIEVKINDHYSYAREDLEQDLFVIAYLCRRNIQDRLEEFGWAMTSPILVPMISRARITLMLAYQQTVGRLQRFAEELDISDEVGSIMDKEEAYYEIDKIVPIQLKNKL